MISRELEYAVIAIARELEYQTRPAAKADTSRAYWQALYQVADQLPSDLVTVYPASAEGLFSVGPLATHFPYPVTSYPTELRTIEALNAHLIELAAARREDYFTRHTPMYSFGFRPSTDDRKGFRGSDLMYLRQNGYADTPPIGYLWTTGVTTTTLDPDTLRVDRPTTDGYWVAESSDLRRHRDRRVYASPLQAYARIAVGVLRWARYTFDGIEPSAEPGALVPLRDSPDTESDFLGSVRMRLGDAP